MRADLLRAARTAFTAHTGSLVSPTRKVTSHSSGMDARNFMSSARPVLFSKVEKSGSSDSVPPMAMACSNTLYLQHHHYRCVGVETLNHYYHSTVSLTQHHHLHYTVYLSLQLASQCACVCVNIGLSSVVCDCPCMAACIIMRMLMCVCNYLCCCHVLDCVCCEGNDVKDEHLLLIHFEVI